MLFRSSSADAGADAKPTADKATAKKPEVNQPDVRDRITGYIIVSQLLHARIADQRKRPFCKPPVRVIAPLALVTFVHSILCSVSLFASCVSLQQRTL